MHANEVIMLSDPQFPALILKSLMACKDEQLEVPKAPFLPLLMAEKERD